MELKRIENKTAMKELVPIYITNTGVKIVNARELHAVLEVKKKFSDWIKQNLRGYVISNEIPQEGNLECDCFTFQVDGLGNRKRIEYAITLDCAKELAMMSRCEKGREIRKYFIEIEKSFVQMVDTLNNTELTPEQKMAEALLIAQNVISNQKSEITKANRNKAYNKKVNVQLRRKIKELQNKLEKAQQNKMSESAVKEIQGQLKDAINQAEYWEGVSTNLEIQLNNKEDQLKAILIVKNDGKKYFNLLANAHASSIIARDDDTKRIRAFSFRKNVIEKNKDVKYTQRFTSNFIEKIHPLSIPIALRTYIDELSNLLGENFLEVIGGNLIQEVYQFLSSSEDSIDAVLEERQQEKAKA